MRILIDLPEYQEGTYIVMCAYQDVYDHCTCKCGNKHSEWIGYKPTFIHIENESLNTYEIVHLDDYPDLEEVLRGTQPSDWNKNEK